MNESGRTLDVVQTGLDVAGLTPAIGIFADGTNAIISAFRGDFTNAGLNVAAMIPILGQGATGGKLAEKALDKVDPNKLNHIFGRADHNLDGLVKQFGSQEKAFEALQTAVRNKGGLEGVFKTTVKLGSETVTVTGKVVDGVAQIGTAFK